MEIDLGNSIQLTKEETEELYAIREPTLEQLVVLAEKCGGEAEIQGNTVIFKGHHTAEWNPHFNLDQNQLLLAAVISVGDCKLFYDDGVHEFFIYRYGPGPEMNPPIAHQYTLQDTAFEAAMNLWFPED